MKKIFFQRVMTALFAVLCIVSQTGCSGKEPVFGTDFLLNTTCSIEIHEDGVHSETQQKELIRRTFALCREYENRLSRTIEESDISNINKAKGQAVLVDSSTAEVIRMGLYYSKISEGLFDITVGELSELWDFSGDNPSVPPADSITEAVKHVDYRKVKILGIGSEEENEKKGVWVQNLDPQTKLDLGGIAKGYIADRAAEYLRNAGVTSAILNFGGNIICIGEKKERTPFIIGVEKPFAAEGGAEKKILGTIPISNLSVVTSGTYERKFYEDGTLYYHILDPATGYPKETDLDGVSIIGPSSVDCDGLSTSCLMLGWERGKKLIDSLEGYEAVFLKKNGEISVTDGLDLSLTE